MLLSSVTKVEICVIVKRQEDGGGLLRPQGELTHFYRGTLDDACNAKLHV